MTPRRKRDGFKEWLSGLFTSKGKMRGIADGSQRQAAPGSFISHAQDFIVQHPTMTTIHGNQYTTTVQGDRNIVPHIMGLLSQHIIQGAAHDSSARTPPPRCHPGTRVKLIARITTWFNSQDPQEVLLWITGPAGVGKSAIVQTFAEYLAKSEFLGASVFISRPNKRNNPNGIFVTIAYQLATRIEAYRNFIVERLSLDPELLRGDMQAQFTTFIVEPFVKKKIGAGGKRWGVLLDGLDELQGEDAQCNVIHVISTFAHDHPDAPILWIIASRRESHILNTFEDDEQRRSYWSEYIPIDSTEACEDVDRFLRSSFKAIQKKFRQCVPSDWPSDTDFLTLTAAASGLFIYAEVVMQFIRDPDRSDPVSQLKILLSVIDRSTAVPTKDNPFVHLDALYHEILSSIPSALWPAAKLLLGFTIHDLSSRFHHANPLENFQTLRGASVLFSLNQNTIYACLTKCRSTLKIPDWKIAHKEKLGLLHASFADYLRNPSRSRDFYVGNRGDVEERMVLNLLEIWNKCSGDDVATASIESTWHQYCSKLGGKAPSKAVAKFYEKLFHNLVDCLEWLVDYILQQPPKSLACDQLCKVHAVKLCYYFRPRDLAHFAINLESVLGYNNKELCREIQLRDLKFEHLDWKEMSPANAREMRRGMLVKDWILHRPRSSAELKVFVSELELLQEHEPELKVTIFGGVPQWRVATFRHETPNKRIRYVIPYPE